MKAHKSMAPLTGFRQLVPYPKGRDVTSNFGSSVFAVRLPEEAFRMREERLEATYQTQSTL